MSEITTAEAYVMMRLRGAESRVEALESELESMTSVANGAISTNRAYYAAIDTHKKARSASYRAINALPTVEDQELWRYLDEGEPLTAEMGEQ